MLRLILRMQLKKTWGRFGTYNAKCLLCTKVLLKVRNMCNTSPVGKWSVEIKERWIDNMSLGWEARCEDTGEKIVFFKIPFVNSIEEARQFFEEHLVDILRRKYG